MVQDLANGSRLHQADVHPSLADVHPNLANVHPNLADVHSNLANVHPNLANVHPNSFLTKNREKELGSSLS